MKNFKRTIATILAISTLCSITAIPTLNISANDVQLGESYSYADSYSKKSITGATGIAVAQVKLVYDDDTTVDTSKMVLLSSGDGYSKYAYLTYYYIDDTTDGIQPVDSLELDTLTNLKVFQNDIYYGGDATTIGYSNDPVKELLDLNGIDYPQDDVGNVWRNDLVYYYNAKTNEYIGYGFCGNEWLVVDMFLPDQYLPSQMPNKVTDLASYIEQMEQIYSKKYVDYNHIDVSDDNVFFKESDNYCLYYKDDGSLASFGYGATPHILFKSTNSRLTLDDVLTKQQRQYLFRLSGDEIDLKLSKLDTDSVTGEIEYYIHLYNDGKVLSDKDFQEYVYGLGQSIMAKGISNNCYFGGYAGFDTANIYSVYPNGTLSVTTTEGMSEEEFTTKYKDILGSYDSISSNGDREYTIVYSKHTDSDDSDSTGSYTDLVAIVKDLKSADGIQKAICTDCSWLSTELAQINHDLQYAIPVVDDIKVTIGESSEEDNKTILNGDVNCDGKLSTLDMLLLKKQLLGIIALDSLGYEHVVGDVNCDGEVTTSDLILLKKAMLGTIDYTLLTNTTTAEDGQDRVKTITLEDMDALNGFSSMNNNGSSMQVYTENGKTIEILTNEDTTYSGLVSSADELVQYYSCYREVFTTDGKYTNVEYCWNITYHYDKATHTYVATNISVSPVTEPQETTVISY